MTMGYRLTMSVGMVKQPLLDLGQVACCSWVHNQGQWDWAAAGSQRFLIKEFVMQDIEREQMEFDVVIVGGGYRSVSGYPLTPVAVAAGNEEFVSVSLKRLRVWCSYFIRCGYGATCAE